MTGPDTPADSDTAARARALLDAAQGDRWWPHGSDTRTVIAGDGDWIAEANSDANAELIAAAPTLITDLLADLLAERDAAVARAVRLEAAIGKHLNDHADERGEQFGCCIDDEALWSAAFDRGTDR